MSSVSINNKRPHKQEFKRTQLQANFGKHSIKTTTSTSTLSMLCSETCRQASLWRDYLSGGAQFLVSEVTKPAEVHRPDLRCSSP